MTTNWSSNGSKVNPMDSTDSTVVMNGDDRNPSAMMMFDAAEASFPSPEEIRTSSTSRINTDTSSNRSIWSGSRSNDMLTSEQTNGTVNKRSKRRTIAVLVVLALFVLLVIVPATVVSSNNKNEAEGSKYFDIVHFLIENQISSVTDVANPISPQSQAIKWLILDDPASTPVPTSSMIDSYEGYMYMVRYVMAVNYFALGGTNWDFDLQFLVADDVCDWNADLTREDTIYRMGLFCANTPNESDGELVNKPYEFSIETNNLSGSIPSENGLLTSLNKFVLTYTFNVNGSIPTELCGLTTLRSLHLNDNNLTGPIPSCMSNMRNLQLLDVSENNLNGLLPETLCQVPLMNELQLGFNEFTGPIPSCFGSMPLVSHLVLHGNKLEGVIPTEICQMNLLNLDVGTNLLESEIPPCIGSIAFLQGLDLSDNFFTGSLPGDLSDSLRILSVNDNELIGDPSDLFNELVELRVLLAANNNFTFQMNSIFVTNTASLKHLDLSGNHNISGMFPAHLLSRTSLVSLDLSSNVLTGSFPDVIDEVNTALKILAVNNNLMSGPVTSLVNISQLMHLDLSSNQFTGPMDVIGELQQLQNLFLSENPFEAAPIPPSFGALTKLEELSLRNTNRTGELIDPSTWIDMIFIDFGSNNLGGTIPENYGLIPFLQYLMLNDNDLLSGNLPTTFQYATELVGIFLDGTSIDAENATELLCDLPNFSNGMIGVEVFIVNCLDTCTDKCSSCLCCDEADQSLCSKSYFDSFDATLDEVYRRTSNFYEVTETVASVFEDHIRH